jgi:hypothetical protein
LTVSSALPGGSISVVSQSVSSTMNPIYL